MPPIVVAGDSSAFERAGVEVVVDFTHLEAACENLEWAAEAGVHAVVGTTGFSGEDYARFRSIFTRSNCLIAPNFAIGAVERMAQASSDWAPDPTRKEVVPSARGGKGPGGIPVHSVRMRGMVAHQEVILGTAGQTLSIRHDSYERVSFMPGVLLGVKAVADLPGVTVGLDGVLGI